jgi:lipoprotein Spr
MHPETRVVGMEDSSSLQASQDEFENMVRNLDVKSRIMDQYADWKGVRYRLGGSTKQVLIVPVLYSVRSVSNLG